MKRRSFFRIGLTTAVLGVFKPVKAARVFGEITGGLNESNAPIVISTWRHGLAANDNAWKVLEEHGPALDAVEHGVRTTESDMTNRSVGIGGRPDRTGHVTLDACIMDEKSNCGAVGCLEGIKHPISVARTIMENTPHVMLVGDGAKDFALDYGFKHVKSPIKAVKKEWKEWKKKNKKLFEKPVINTENHDTIGMLALDSNGNLSGACTTSGWGYKLPGRIGDSPIIGAGLFVDNEVGAACATGLGEAVIRIAGSHTVVELMRQGRTPQQACEEAVARIIDKHENVEGLQVGFLALDKKGNYGAYSVFNGFNFAVKSTGQSELIDAGFDRNW
ncbi:MAG: N(4)-(beta-N-acetylglucosaminyl)-L-asparaginase [Crocinitomicaceae bacterium]|nr:N(4)-(beta-N-acetylglucosaminyl)-L-asparaginase [Crocinitomicaceae bacterium]